MKILTLAERKRRFEKWRKRPLPKITTYYLDEYYEHRDDSIFVRESYAQRAFWLKSEKLISPDDLIIGKFFSNEPVVFHYGCGTFMSYEVAEAYAVQEHMTETEKKDLDEKMHAVSERAYQYYAPIFTDEEFISIESHAASTTWFGGHMVLDYETVLKEGLSGYREKIKTARKMYGVEKKDFYDAMEIILESIVLLILRFADAAEKMAEDGNENMAELVKVLRYIAEKPPETFHQALQLVWILHMIDNCDSFGRFDDYMLPYFEKDMAEGRITTEEAKALLVDFWIKIEQGDQIQNMTIGGVDKEGKKQYSLLTELCLDVTRELAYKGPNLSLRITSDMPENIWKKALDCIGTGIGLPALYNDKIYTDNLIRARVPEKTARGYSFAGCSQLMIPGKSNFVNDIGLLNVGKIVEITLYGGLDPRTGKQVGVKTKIDFSSFEELYTAFEMQLEYFCKLEVSIHNKEIPYRALHEGYVLRTLFTQDCLEKGRGVFQGGARYNHTQLELIGITNAADSLYAAKKAVFEERYISLEDLRKILRKNWGGEEEIHRYFVNLPKFGNGLEEVDELRVRITDWLYSRFNEEPAPLGGRYVPGEVIFTSHEGCGHVTGATPDGRYQGQVMADSAGAAGGYDREGITALMNSVLKLPVKNYLLTSTVVNLKFLPDIFNGARTRNGIEALLKGYFAQGGMQLQINVCGSETLRQAQKEPENYPGLIVRVGGYSEYFVKLSKDLQDEIIARTEHGERC